MTDHPTKPPLPRNGRRRGAQGKGRISSRLLPAEPGSADGSGLLAAAPVARRRRHPAVEYTMLKRLLTDLQYAGEAIEQLVLHMEMGNLPEMPELLSTREINRKAIATVLKRLDGE
jgi:hypothetical protein